MEALHCARSMPLNKRFLLVAILCLTVIAALVLLSTAVADPPTSTITLLADFHQSDASLPDLKSFPQYVAPIVLDKSTKERQCPAWESYDKDVQMAKDFSNSCKPVESGSQNVEIQLCQSELLCGQGYFLVNVTDKEQCARSMVKPLSLNKPLEEFYRNRIGPDAFHLTFNGPQRETPPMWTHLQNCLYKLPFRLTNPGLYTVTLLHAFQDFAAIDETTPLRPEPIFQPLLPPNFTVSVCPDCPTFTSTSVSTLPLPLCSRTLPQQGVYLPLTNQTARESRMFRYHHHPYIWEPLGCRFDQRFESGENSHCHASRNTSIRALGDSQLRFLMAGVDGRFAGESGQEPIVHRKYNYLHTKYYSANERAILGLSRRGEGGVTQRDEGEGEVDPVFQDTFDTSRNHTEIEFTFMAFMEKFLDTSAFNAYQGYDDSTNTFEAERMLLGVDKLVLDGGHWNMQSYSLGGHFR
ncbi:hypothetical protein HDU98_006644 [Podochytrium sp. JEL0797]|nr:hypothetical protein HDU98_006644 [Podochytrium sp. JEL0797]